MTVEMYPEYSVDEEIDSFFAKTSATRVACDARAEELTGGKAVAINVQGNCSYSVYAGPALEFVVQFRLMSLRLRSEIPMLAREVYGSLAPEIMFKGQIGDESDEKKEPLYTYMMSRIRGVTHLDFILAHNSPENSLDNFTWRKNLIADVARFAYTLFILIVSTSYTRYNLRSIAPPSVDGYL